MSETTVVRKVRETGFYVNLISGLDGYTLHCGEHGYTCSWDKKTDAIMFWPYPSEWCEECCKIILEVKK